MMSPFILSGGNLTVLLVLTCHVILSKERSYIRVLPGTYAYSSQVESFLSLF